MEVVLETDSLSTVSRPDISLRIRKFIKTIESSPKFRGAARERRDSPRVANPRTTSAKCGEIDFTLFHGPVSFLSPMSRSTITIGNKSFRSAEQFYQYSRAVYAKDQLSADAIHTALTPLKARALGRSVKRHDTEKWADLAPDVMALALYHKYMQNRPLREALLATGDSAIVYCERLEKQWGCGLGMSEDPTDVAKWTGQNILGKILTILREHIQSGDCQMFALG